MSILGEVVVDFHARGDQAIQMVAEKYVIRSIIALEARPNRPAGAAAGLFTASNGGGLCLVSHTQGFENAGGETFEELALTPAATARVLSDPLLFLRFNTACVVPSSGRVIIYGEKL